MQLTRTALPTLTAAFLALLAAPHAQARTLAQIKASGILRVATPGDLPPFSMVKGASYSGYEVEFLEAVARDMGVTLSLQTVSGGELIRALQDDRADVAIGAMGITSTRENKVDFTVPIACAGVSVVSLNPSLQKHTDLVGKKIAVGSGSIMHSYVQKLPFEKQVNVYPTSGDVMFAVISKAVDATFAYTVMQPAVKRMFPKADIFFGPELWSVPIGMMVREDNVTTRLALNAGISKYLQTNSYAFLTARHFGKDVRCKS